jgi:hypothetical protein
MEVRSCCGSSDAAPDAYTNGRIQDLSLFSLGFFITKHKAKYSEETEALPLHSNEHSICSWIIQK